MWARACCFVTKEAALITFRIVVTLWRIPANAWGASSKSGCSLFVRLFPGEMLATVRLQRAAFHWLRVISMTTMSFCSSFDRMDGRLFILSLASASYCMYYGEMKALGMYYIVTKSDAHVNHSTVMEPLGSFMVRHSALCKCHRSKHAITCSLSLALPFTFCFSAGRATHTHNHVLRLWQFFLAADLSFIHFWPEHTMFATHLSITVN